MKAILVRAPNWIGDQILAFPFYHYLRKSYPGARIIAACPPWVADVQFRHLVNHVIRLPKPESASLWDRFAAIEGGVRDLRAVEDEFDLAISLPNSFGAAWFIWRSGALVKRGYLADGRGVLLNDGIPMGAGQTLHRAQAYLNLLPDAARRNCKRHAEFWGVAPENELDPFIPGELERFDAAIAWPTADPLDPPTRKFWILAPGATADSRRWGLDRFARLAKQVHADTGWQGLVIGGEAEKEGGARLAGDPDLGLLDWTGLGSVSKYWRCFSEARLTICNESGLAHVAALCGSPVQIVCGAADPKRTKPVGPGAVQVAINAVDCWPCEKNICLLKDDAARNQCLRGIEPDRVWEEARRVARKN